MEELLAAERLGGQDPVVLRSTIITYKLSGLQRTAVELSHLQQV